MASFATRAVAVAIIAIALYFVVEVAPRPSFPVHTSGAILITGTSSGIGRDAAVELAKRGYVVYGSVRKEKDADDIRALKMPNFIPIIMDVTNEDQIQAAVKTLSQSKLPLIALVNNAGISTRSPLEATPIDDVKKIYNTNVFGVHMVTQAFLPMLRASKGRIVNIGSVAGLVATAGSSVYSGSKFALEAITDALRRELSDHQISVSIVEPAYVKTQIASKHLDAQAAKDSDKPHPLHKTYPKFYDTELSRRTRAFENADTTEVTTTAIVDAITAKSPKTRYVVANVDGAPAKLLTWVTWLVNDYLEDILVNKPESVTWIFSGKKN